MEKNTNVDRQIFLILYFIVNQTRLRNFLLKDFGSSLNEII